MLLTAPSGAVQMVMIWIGMLGCYLLPNNRCLVLILLCIPPLVGNLLLMKLPLSASWGLIVSSWLVSRTQLLTTNELGSKEDWQASCISDIMVIILSLSASNVKGNTKRSIVNTLFFIGYCASNIGAPQLWTTDAAPRYFDGVVLNISAWCTTILAISLYWGLCYFDNRRRDQGHAAYPGRVYQPGEDLTDKEDNLFRYSY